MHQAVNRSLVRNKKQSSYAYCLSYVLNDDEEIMFR